MLSHGVKLLLRLLIQRLGRSDLSYYRQRQSSQEIVPGDCGQGKRLSVLYKTTWLQ